MNLCLATHSHTPELRFSFLSPIGCSEHYDGASFLRSNPTLFQINQPLFPQMAPFNIHTNVVRALTVVSLWLPGTSLQLCALPSIIATAEDVFLFAHPSDWVHLCCCWQLMNASSSPLASLLRIKNHLWEYHIILSSSPNVTLRRCWHLKEVDQTPRGLYSWSEWYSAWPGWDGFDCGISGAIFVAQFGPVDVCTEGKITDENVGAGGHHVGCIPTLGRVCGHNCEASQTAKKWHLLRNSSGLAVFHHCPLGDSLPLTGTIPSCVNLQRKRQLTANIFMDSIVYLSDIERIDVVNLKLSSLKLDSSPEPQSDPVALLNIKKLVRSIDFNALHSNIFFKKKPWNA